MFSLRSITVVRSIKASRDIPFCLGYDHQRLFSSSEEKETGVMKFYDRRNRFGFVFSDTDKTELFVARRNIKEALSCTRSRHPFLKTGEQIEFTRTTDDKGNLVAHDITFKGGRTVPHYRKEHADAIAQKAKTELGYRVFDILSQEDTEKENDMAESIAAAFNKAVDKINEGKRNEEK